MTLKRCLEKGSCAREPRRLGKAAALGRAGRFESLFLGGCRLGGELGVNLLVGLPDDELVQAIEDRMDEDDIWLLDELVRRHVLSVYRLLLAEERLEVNSWLGQLGAAA